MNDESKEVAKIWKIVAWILLSLALLVSVLIISQTWYPELLGPDSESNPDKPYKWIIASIALVASVSLLSFLIQTYLKKPEEVPKIWKIIAYPVHFALRIVVLMVLVAIRSFIMFLLAISILSAKILDSVLSEFLDSALADPSDSMKSIWELLEVLISYPLIIPIVIIVIVLILHRAEKLWRSLQNVKNGIVEVFRDEWLPRLDVKRSLRLTWKCYGKNVGPSILELFTQSGKLLVILLGISIVLMGLASLYIKQIGHPDRVNEGNKSDHSHPDLKDKILDHSHKPSAAYPFKKNAMYSLVYREGRFKVYKDSLETEDGICPSGSNLRWLKLFKAAILECSKNNRMKFRVQGFASVAPVTVNGLIDSQQSDILNCEIANQRAEAIIYFLTTSEPYNSTECKAAINHEGRWGREKGNPCTRGRLDTNAWKGSGFTVTYDDSQRVHWERQHLTMTYKPWQSYEKMNENKPLKNPAENSKNKVDRQRDLEFLNRSVQIIIEDGGDCWKEAVEDTGQSD